MKLTLPIPIRYNCSPSYGECGPYLHIANREADFLITQAGRGFTREQWGKPPSGSLPFLAGRMSRWLIKGIGLLDVQPALYSSATGDEIVIVNVRLNLFASKLGSECPCCFGCLTVGIISNYKDITNEYIEHGVILCAKEGNFFIKNAKCVDGNIDHKEGERIIVYSTPVIQSKKGLMTYESEHRYVKFINEDDAEPLFMSRKWNILNCSGWSINVEENGQIYEDSGISTEFIETSSSCGKRKSKIKDETGYIVEIDMAHYITSIKAGSCFGNE